MDENLMPSDMEGIIALAISKYIYDSGLLGNVCVTLQQRGVVGSSVSTLPNTPRVEITPLVKQALDPSSIRTS